MTKDLDQKVAHAMGLKSVNNCEKWGTSMDVDKLLVEAGAYFAGDGVNYDRFEPRKFSNLVAAKEREACAKVCEEAGTVEQWDGLSEAADRIRARGEQA